MKLFKKGLAVLLAILLITPTLPAVAEEATSTETFLADEVLFNTGNHTVSVVKRDSVKEGTVDVYGNDFTTGDVSDNNPEIGIVGEDDEASEERGGDDYFAEDGSYTINIPEDNPFFPYEVQFICDGKVTREWFMIF